TPPPRPRPPETSARKAKLEREANEARAEADKWEKRRADAVRAGDRALAEQAAREADRKRARMHMALADLARLANEPVPPPPRPPPPPGHPPPASRRRAAPPPAPGGPGPLEEELAALKSRMEAEKRGRG